MKTRAVRLGLEPLEHLAAPSTLAPADVPVAADPSTDVPATVAAALAADTHGVALAFLIVPNWQGGGQAGPSGIG